MKTISPLFLFFFLYLITLGSCGKAIPDETMDGRGTFYCKVNGEDYFPDCTGFACQDVGANYFSFDDAISIGTQRNDKVSFMNILIYIYNIQSDPSIIDIDSLEPSLDNTQIFQHCGSTYLENEEAFSLEITKIDLDERIISGTFSGVFKRFEENHQCPDTIYLTDGIFDLPISF